MTQLPESLLSKGVFVLISTERSEWRYLQRDVSTPAGRSTKHSPVIPHSLPLILVKAPFQGLASIFPPLILIEATFQGLTSAFPTLILVEAPFQGLASVFPPLILVGVPMGATSSKIRREIGSETLCRDKQEGNHTCHVESSRDIYEKRSI